MGQGALHRERASSSRARRRAARIDEQAVRFSPRLHGAFCWWLRSYLRRHFNCLRYRLPDGTEERLQVPRRGLVVYSNHPSWWDPILFFVVGAEVFPEHAGFGPMDAEQLERYRFFKRLGVFGVEPGTRSGARAFLRASEQVLEQDECLLWVTAQGDFVDVRRRPAGLEPGLGHLAERASRSGEELTFVPCALEIVHWSERLPEALLQFGTPIATSEVSSSSSAAEWTHLLEERLHLTQDDLAEAAQLREPERFTTALAGERGVGGVFDAYRRLRAALTGRSFEAAHLDRS